MTAVETTGELDRRTFLIKGLGGLALGVVVPAVLPRSMGGGAAPMVGAGPVPAGATEASIGDAPTTVTAYIRIAPDDTVTIMFGGTEFGQGTMTGVPQVVAEELKVEWAKVRVEQADPRLGLSYMTGGSSATRRYFDALRKAGATAREMLLAAGAQQLGVAAADCRAEAGRVVTDAGGTRQAVGYGAIAELAATMPVPVDPPLTAATDFTLIGRSVKRVDVPAKVNGSAIYGMDVRVPGMAYAVVKHSPMLGGTLLGTVKKPSGTLAVVPLIAPANRGAVRAGTTAAVAVVADNTWRAMKGAKGLKVRWTSPANASSMTTDTMRAGALALLAADAGLVTESAGDADAGLATPGATTIDVTYELPYVPHVCMEVLTCTASVTASTCEIWAPTQWAAGVVTEATRLTGLPASAITVHTTLVGGGLGRKIEIDFVSYAIQVAKALGRPIKVMWPREEDFSNDHWRPSAQVRVRAAVTPDGSIVGWRYHNVSPSISRQRGRSTTTVDSSAVEGSTMGGADDLPYQLPARHISWTCDPAAVPVGYWRSVGHSINAFAVESALDELAAAVGIDPMAMRRGLLAPDSRERRVLDEADRMTGWRNTLRPGRAWGMAIHRSFETIVCQVVSVSGTATSPKVDRVSCIVDCGLAVNPASVEMQMQGGIVHGLNAALWGRSTFTNGVPAPKNFTGYRMLRVKETPQIEVSIINSGAKMGGIGEPGVPPIAPAVANALARLTGTRNRKLPML